MKKHKKNPGSVFENFQDYKKQLVFLAGSKDSSSPTTRTNKINIIGVRQNG